MKTKALTLCLRVEDLERLAARASKERLPPNIYARALLLKELDRLERSGAKA